MAHEGFRHEIVEFYRRIIFISLMPFFGRGSARTGIGCCLALLSVIIYREACPYQNGATNVLAVTAQYQVLGAEQVRAQLARPRAPPRAARVIPPSFPSGAGPACRAPP